MKKTEEIIDKIKRLPVEDRLGIIEKTTKTIRMKSGKEKMKKAANQLYEDYKNDTDLIAFTDLDMEDFYETR